MPTADDVPTGDPFDQANRLARAIVVEWENGGHDGVLQSNIVSVLAPLLAKLRAVEAVHVPVHGYCVACDRDRDVETLGNNPDCEHRPSYCRGCDYVWPCATRRALDAS